MNLNYEYIEHLKGLYIKIFPAVIGINDLHWHEDIEILYMLYGSVEIKLNNKFYILNKGDIFVISSNDIHCVNKLSSNKLIILQINPEFSSRYYPGLDLIKFDCNSTEPVDEKRLESLNSIKIYTTEIMKQLESMAIGHEFRICALTNMILATLLTDFTYSREDNKTININSTDLERLSKILDYIKKNYMEGICLDDISKNVCMSKYYMAHFFKARTGLTIWEYINTIRINKAIEMIMTGKQKISAIAYECGFKSAKYFNRIFKDKLGCNPSEYRNSISRATGFRYNSVN